MFEVDFFDHYLLSCAHRASPRFHSLIRKSVACDIGVVLSFAQPSRLEHLGFIRFEFNHPVFVLKRLSDNISCISKIFLTFIKGEIDKAFGIRDRDSVKTFPSVQIESNFMIRGLLKVPMVWYCGPQSRHDPAGRLTSLRSRSAYQRVSQRSESQFIFLIFTRFHPLASSCRVSLRGRPQTPTPFSPSQLLLSTAPNHSRINCQYAAERRNCGII